MLETAAWAAHQKGQPLAPFTLQRRDVGPHDVLIELEYCGICHSDIHQARDEWSGATFPMVPGHEMVGRVRKVGGQVTRFRVGDRAGVGCIVDSCRTCEPCRGGTEQFCEKGVAWSYNATEMDRRTPTYGGYSSQVVVTEAFTLQVPESLDPAGAAPLLCAGITTYSPLVRFGVKKGDRVGVVGLGGLGHMAVKLAAAMGAKVTVLSTSPSKEADARRLGAQAFACTREEGVFKKLGKSLDLIVDTLSVVHDYGAYLGLLRTEGVMVMVGAPSQPSPLSTQSLINGNRLLAGSLIGGIAQTQAMLDYCAQHRIVSDVELIPIQKVNEAYERVLKSDVRYRFVIDLASLRG